LIEYAIQKVRYNNHHSTSCCNYSRFHIYVDQAEEGEKDFSVSEDLDGSEPRVGFTSEDFPTPRYFNGKIKDLRYYPSAIYKDLAERGE
jgi:hypothetical protein